MSYRCHNFCNGEVLKAEPLNEMEQAIVDLENRYHNAVIIIPEHGNEISVADASESPFVGMTLCGKTTQNGTPAQNAQVPLVSVGNGGNISVTVAGADESQTLEVYTTADGLPGIPVDDGWISDEIDLGRGVYVQRVNKIVLTGAESWLSANTINGVNVLYLQPIFPLAAAETGLCTHFPYDRAKAYGGQEGYIGAEAANVTGKSRIWVSTTMTAAEFKSFLAEHPVTVMYPMAEPVETALDADLLAEFAKLHSYKPNTTVSNDAGAEMTLEYVADTKTYVDNHGGNVDLTGYATEQWVQKGYQPKGEYLTEVPKGYAKTEDIPTKPEDIGAQPSGNYALKTEIPPVPVQSVNGKTGAVSLSASDVKARPDNWMPTAQDVGALPATYTPPNQTAEQVGADPKGTAAAAVSQHNTAEQAHNDIRLALQEINTRLNAFFDADDKTLDELSEIVAYITSNKSLIDAVTTSKVNVTDIINNLTTNISNKPLSAAQGVVLKGLIDALSASLANYQPKGDYALVSQLPSVPVQSVNGQTGAVKLSASDVGARPSDWVPSASEVKADPAGTASAAIAGHNTASDTHQDIRKAIPQKTSQLENDSNFLTQHQDISNLLPRSELTTAVNAALKQAKESGEFDGEDGEDATATDAVRYGEQTLTPQQKAQARANIGAAAETEVPSYWLSELETKAEDIRIAMETAGRNKSAFLWYTDAHWQTNSKKSPVLLDYLCKNTSMNKVNFGGDIVNDPSPHNHENTKYVYDWRRKISNLPNHHSVYGNHDVYHRAANVNNIAYTHLIAPEESAEMVVGGESYYYIDNPSEKTRYLYLSYITAGAGFSDSDTAAEMLAQGKFITDSLVSLEEGWHVVAIAHRWYQYAKDSNNQLVIEGGSFPFYEAEILRFFDAYNARLTTHVSPNYIVPVDCSKAKGKVEFCIGGHCHLDHDFTTDGGIPVVVTASDTNQERNTGEDEDNGTIGTTSESAVFGIIADYTDAENTKITVIGVGRGTSRVIGGAVEPELVNLFDKNDSNVLLGGRINSSHNAVYYAENQLLTGYMEAELGNVITISSDKANNANSYTGSIDMYDSDKKWLGMYSWQHIHNNTAVSSDDYKTVTIKIVDTYPGQESTKAPIANTAFFRATVAYTDIDSVVITKQ